MNKKDSKTYTEKQVSSWEQSTDYLKSKLSDCNGSMKEQLDETIKLSEQYINMLNKK